jgi:nucleotide-binding universal stress UspA family protein
MVRAFPALYICWPVQWRIGNKPIIMDTIIVATDFSKAAEHAAGYAADMAVDQSAEIVLLHICNLPASYTEIPVAALPDNTMAEAAELLQQAQQKLLHQTGGKAAISTLVRMGFFYTELKTVCDEIKPYMVVMGSQGTTPAQRLIWGGHTAYAMQHLPWPLLAVPPNIKYTGVQKIGFACDFKKVIPTTPAAAIQQLVKRFGASLHVINTGKEETLSEELVYESGMLQEMLEGIRPFYHFLQNDNVEEGIAAFASANQLDLLIVLPKRHNFFDRILHPSHTKQLALHCPVPVLAMHEGE